MARRPTDQLSYLSAFAKKKLTGGAHAAKAKPRTFAVGKSKVEIFTDYRVFVGGKRVKIDLEVADDGTVVCHALPFYRAASAVDVVKYAVQQAIAASKLAGKIKPGSRRKPKSGRRPGMGGGQ